MNFAARTLRALVLALIRDCGPSERLSFVSSSGLPRFALPKHGVEDGEKSAQASDEGDLGGASAQPELLVVGPNDRVEAQRRWNSVSTPYFSTLSALIRHCGPSKGGGGGWAEAK